MRPTIKSVDKALESISIATKCGAHCKMPQSRPFPVAAAAASPIFPAPPTAAPMASGKAFNWLPAPRDKT
jgi:hypothetical protein